MALQEEYEKQGNWLFKYRGVLPIAILVIGFAIYLYAEFHQDAFVLEGTSYEPYYEALCLLLSLLGLAVRVYTIGYTPANTSGRNTTEQVADTVNTDGIYSIVRHPLYVGNFLIWLGIALLTGNFWFVCIFCLIYWIYYERIMFSEEQFLRGKFGKTYTDWANITPAFIPKFKQFRKSELPFSWKKVLKKEKDGFLALFLVFSLFDISGELVERQADFNYILLTMSIIVIIFYAVVKYLKYKTNVLAER